MLFGKYIYILALEMAMSPANRHCASRIGTLCARTIVGTVRVVGRRAVSPGRANLRLPQSTDVVDARLAHAPETLRDVMTAAVT